MHAKLMGNNRRNMMQAYRQLETELRNVPAIFYARNSSVEVVKENNDK